MVLFSFTYYLERPTARRVPSFYLSYWQPKNDVSVSLLSQGTRGNIRYTDVYKSI
jgi:hypothetical protein